jgi:hypothetical protein
MITSGACRVLSREIALSYAADHSTINHLKARHAAYTTTGGGKNWA